MAAMSTFSSLEKLTYTINKGQLFAGSQKITQSEQGIQFPSQFKAKIQNVKLILPIKHRNMLQPSCRGI